MFCLEIRAGVLEDVRTTCCATRCGRAGWTSKGLAHHRAAIARQRSDGNISIFHKLDRETDHGLCQTRSRNPRFYTRLRTEMGANDHHEGPRNVGHCAQTHAPTVSLSQDGNTKRINLHLRPQGCDGFPTVSSPQERSCRQTQGIRKRVLPLLAGWGFCRVRTGE